MAGLIPQSFIDDLINRADIVEIINAHVSLKKAGREYTACCPFHDEKSPSFTVSPQKQFYHCFGCGAHGTVLGFMMDYERLEFVDAIEELASRYGLEVPRDGGTNEPRDNESRARNQAILEVLEQANVHFKRSLREHPQAQSAKEYLKGRGMSGRTAQAFEIGYAPPGWDNLLNALGHDEHAIRALSEAGLLSEGEDGKRRYDRFRDRIMFPIHDRRGRVVGFGARTLGDDTPKYLNSPETAVFHKGRELYGLFRVQQLRERPDTVIVVEGYMDVAMLHEFGIDYACAALGTAATPDQMERLFRFNPDVVFCFDGDKAGRRAAWRALENALPFMRDGCRARFMFLPDGDDPDSFVQQHGKEAFEALLARAPTLTEFLFQNLRENNDTHSPEGQARLKEQARPLIERLPDGTLKTLAAQRLAQLLGLSLDRTEGELGISHMASVASSSQASSFAREQTRTPRSVVTPARRAITALVHFPALAAHADDVRDIALLGTAGAGLLAEMITTLKMRPNLSTAGLLEHFRDHAQGEALMRLATSEPPPQGDALRLEFLDCLNRVRHEPIERRYQYLRERVRDKTATDAEAHEYGVQFTNQHRRADKPPI
ncbi:MAG: DNA primase [Gammaproteobacteria bacterium]|jgi:DNA primase